MLHNREQRPQGIFWPLSISLAFFLFYLFTLAPTVLWGDDAYFQRVALTGELRADGGGHWLWLQLARLFARIPWADVAFRTNLLSAVAASGTILILYGAARQAGLRRDAATVAVVSLGFGHTFWMHAVRAEVYTVFTLFVAFHFWLWTRWRPLKMDSGSAQTSRVWPFYVGAALFGVTLLAHQMALFLIPSWALLAWRRSDSLRRSQLMTGATLLLVGLVPFLLVLHHQIVVGAGVTMLEAIRLYFTHAGADFSAALFVLSAQTFPRDVLMGIVLTLLQFSSPAIALVMWGIVARWRSPNSALWRSMLFFYGVNTLFAITYDVNDRYVFLLPGYLALALFAGAGWEAARKVFEARGQGPAAGKAKMLAVASLALLIAMPLSLYYLAPRVLVAAGANPMQARALPEREPNEFFLWPGKRDYYGAARYGEDTLAALPEGAVLIADHTPIQTLKYLQMVRGRRPDVRLVAIEPGDDLGPVIEKIPQTVPIYLADSNPNYYNLRSLPDATLAASGPIFRLELRLN